MITAARGRQKVTRNVSHFRRAGVSVMSEEGEIDDSMVVPPEEEVQSEGTQASVSSALHPLGENAGQGELLPRVLPIGMALDKIWPYLTTPHSTTGVTPSRLLIGRDPRTKLTPEWIECRVCLLTFYSERLLRALGNGLERLLHACQQCSERSAVLSGVSQDRSRFVKRVRFITELITFKASRLFSSGTPLQ
ncbi:hypothetical protein NDU88_001555 [Pleurodeles waltl]|uniref:Uncharacterized protein n=1 Tax=Pleurodeles waltl TaxID=8319 RepID=A0AAV7MN08_PLEWA|nr:hypothetical protein NDU88_001555 [Pleurodeles waltl]